MLVYRVVHRASGKVYIGKWLAHDVERRWRAHVRRAEMGSCFHFHNALRKYGETSFNWEVIYRARTDDPKREIARMETFFIVLHQSFTPQFGYNMTMGGDGCNVSPEGHKRIGLKLRGRKRRPESIEATVSKLRGRIRSKAFCDKVSAARMGMHFSDSHRKNLVLAQVGLWPERRRQEQSDRQKKQIQERSLEFLQWSGRKAAAARWGHVFTEVRPEVAA